MRGGWRVILQPLNHPTLTHTSKQTPKMPFQIRVRPGFIEYSEFLIPFELLFREIKPLDLCDEDMPLIKVRLLDTALTLYQNFSSDQD